MLQIRDPSCNDTEGLYFCRVVYKTNSHDLWLTNSAFAILYANLPRLLCLWTWISVDYCQNQTNLYCSQKARMMNMINRIALSEPWWSLDTDSIWNVWSGRPRGESKCRKMPKESKGLQDFSGKAHRDLFFTELLSYKLCNFYILITTVSELLNSEFCVLYDRAGPQSKMSGDDVPPRQLWITAYLQREFVYFSCSWWTDKSTGKGRDFIHIQKKCRACRWRIWEKVIKTAFINALNPPDAVMQQGAAMFAVTSTAANSWGAGHQIIWDFFF